MGTSSTVADVPAVNGNARGADEPSEKTTSITRRTTAYVDRDHKRRVTQAISTARRAGMFYDSESMRRASGWLLRLVSGCKDDLRSNIFTLKGKGKRKISMAYAQVIGGWDKRYNQGMANHAKLRVLFTDELEKGNRDKIGPKSMYKGYFEDGPEKTDKVMSDKPIPKSLNRKAFKRALERLNSEVPSQSIRLQSIKQVLEQERSEREAHEPEAPGLDSTTNSGPPFFKRAWKPNDEMGSQNRRYTEMVYEYIYHKSSDYYRKLAQGDTVTFMAMTGQRTVQRGLHPLTDPKQGPKVKRFIQALEKTEAVLWKTFTPAVMEILRHLRPYPAGNAAHMAWCDTPVIDKECHKVLDYCHQHRLPIISGDVSNFDASVVPALWLELAHAMSDWFYRSKKFFEALNESVISNVVLLDPRGLSGPGPSSIKSGSGGTNFIDTQYNKLALYYGEECGFYKIEAAAFQGDDFFSAGSGMTSDGVAEAYKHLNLTVSVDKQSVLVDALMFLQRLHLYGLWGGIASSYRVLGSTLVYEKMSQMLPGNEWNPYMEAIQVISKLENASFHPLFEELVEYVKMGDKFHLGADKSASEVIKLAGTHAGDLLAQQTAQNFNSQTMEKTSRGFQDSADRKSVV